MAKAGFVTPKISFLTLNYSNIEAGSFFFGFDLDNAGKLSKMDNLGNITVIEGAAEVPDSVFELGAGTESANHLNTTSPNYSDGDYSFTVGSSNSALAENSQATGKNVNVNSENSHGEGSANFALDKNAYTSISAIDSINNIITVVNVSIFSIGDKIAYVYQAYENNNLVHYATISNISGDDLYVDSAIDLNGSEFHADGTSLIFNLSVAPLQYGNQHVEGSYTVATGLNAHAEGRKTIATGSHSHAEGVQTQAAGQNSHAEGEVTVSSGNASHSEGRYTTASGQASHAEGSNSEASGQYAHAEGSLTTASGQSSHAEGNQTTATGLASHAEGNLSQATNSYAHAGGSNARATRYAEWARSSNGDNGQYGIVHYTQKTTAIGVTKPTLGGGTDYFTIPTGQAYRLRITAIVINQNTGDAKEFSGEGLIKNIGGTTSLVGSITMASTFGDAGLATAAIFIGANDTLDILDVNFSSPVADTLFWSLKVEYVNAKF